MKARKQVEEEKQSLAEDIPTPDIAVRLEKEPEMTNQIVRKKWEYLGPFVYRTPELPEVHKLRWLKPYVSSVIYIKYSSNSTMEQSTLGNG